MRRAPIVSVLVAFALAACGGGTGPDSSSPPRLSVQPSDQLVQAAESGSGDFTWSLFRDEVLVRLVQGDFSDDMKLCAVQVFGEEARGTECSPSLEVTTADLTGGTSSADLIPSDAPPFLPGEDWFPLEGWSPTEFVLPAAFEFPRQNNVVNAFLSEVTLADDEGMVIVFAASGDPFIVPGEVPFRVRGFALKLAREQAE